MGGRAWTTAENDWLMSNHGRFLSHRDLYQEFSRVFCGRGSEGVKTHCTKTLRLVFNGNVSQYGAKQKEELPLGTERIVLFNGQPTVYVKTLLTGGGDGISGYQEPYWKPKQKKAYEDFHGPVKKGGIIVFLDQDHANFSIENLYCVNRKILAVMNKNKWFTDSREHNLAAIRWCELFYALKNAR